MDLGQSALLKRRVIFIEFNGVLYIWERERKTKFSCDQREKDVSESPRDLNVSVRSRDFDPERFKRL